MTYLFHILTGFELIQFLFMDSQLLCKSHFLLFSALGNITPVMNFPQITSIKDFGIVFKLDFITVREILIFFPTIEIIHLVTHFFQFLNALFQVTKFLDAKLLQNSLFKCILLDCCLCNIFRRRDSYKTLSQIRRIIIFITTWIIFFIFLFLLFIFLLILGIDLNFFLQLF